MPTPITLTAADQAATAAQLRKLADDLEAGRALVTDLYAGVTAIDTTPEGDADRTAAVDPNSYLLVLRYARPAQ